MSKKTNEEYKLFPQSEKDSKPLIETIHILRIAIIVIVAIIMVLVVSLIIVAKTDFTSNSEREVSKPSEKQTEQEEKKNPQQQEEEIKPKEEEESKTEEEETEPEPEPEPEPFIPGGPSSTIFNNNYKVIGYYPHGNGDVTSKIQFGKITHLLYAHGYPAPSGNGEMEEISKFNWVVSQMIKACNNNNVVPILSVGGYTYSSTTTLASTFFEANTNTDAKIQSFAESIISQAISYGFKGIDLDWEFPTSSNMNNFGKLISALKTLCDKNKMTLSAAVSGDSTTGFTADVIKKLDFISIISFSKTNQQNTLSYDYLTKAVDMWKKKGFAKEKILVGVPFNGIPGSVSFDNIVSKNSNCANTDTCSIDGTTIYYNGISTIKKKADYAGKNAGGIMISDITQDSTVSGKKLVDTIYDSTVSTVGLAEK